MGVIGDSLSFRTTLKWCHLLAPWVLHRCLVKDEAKHQDQHDSV